MKKALLHIFFLVAVLSACAQQPQTIKLTQLEKSQTVEGTKAGQLGLTNSDGVQRYAQYVEIDLNPIDYIPASTGNTLNLSEFVIDTFTRVWYIDWQGRGLLLKDTSGAGDDLNGYYGGNGGNGGDGTVPGVTKATLTDQLTHFITTSPLGGKVPVRIEIADGDDFGDFLSCWQGNDSLYIYNSDDNFTLFTNRDLFLDSENAIRLRTDVAGGATEQNLRMGVTLTTPGTWTNSQTAAPTIFSQLSLDANEADGSNTWLKYKDTPSGDESGVYVAGKDNVAMGNGAFATDANYAIYAGEHHMLGMLSGSGDQVLVIDTITGKVARGAVPAGLGVNIYNSDGFFPANMERAAILDTLSQLAFRYSSGNVAFQINGDSDSLSMDGGIYMQDASGDNWIQLDINGAVIAYANDKQIDIHSTSGNGHMQQSANSTSILNSHNVDNNAGVEIDTVGSQVKLVSNNNGIQNIIGFDRSVGNGVYIQVDEIFPSPGQTLVAGADQTFYFADTDTLPSSVRANEGVTMLSDTVQLGSRFVSVDGWTNNISSERNIVNNQSEISNKVSGISFNNPNYSAGEISIISALDSLNFLSGLNADGADGDYCSTTFGNSRLTTYAQSNSAGDYFNSVATSTSLSETVANSVGSFSQLSLTPGASNSAFLKHFRASGGINTLSQTINDESFARLQYDQHSDSIFTFSGEVGQALIQAQRVTTNPATNTVSVRPDSTIVSDKVVISYSQTNPTVNELITKQYFDDNAPATVTASNGLTKTVNDIALGGTLTSATTIDANTVGEFLEVTGIGTSTTLGVFRVDNNSTGLAMRVSSDGKGAYIDVNSANTALEVVGNGNADALVVRGGATGAAIYADCLSSTDDAVQASASSGTAISGTSTTGKGAWITINPSSTSTIDNVIDLERKTSGTAAIGIGASADFLLETTLGSTSVYGQYVVQATSVTAATATAKTIIRNINSGTSNDCITISGNGAVQLNDYGVGTFTGTPAKSLAVDASGNVIETSVATSENIYNTSSSITASTARVVTIPSTSSLEFTYDGTNDFLTNSSGFDFHMTNPDYFFVRDEDDENTLKVSSNGVDVTALGEMTVAGNLDITGDLSLLTAGDKIFITTGEDAIMGTATLVAGSVTVNTTAVLTASTIFVSLNTPGGVPGWISAPSAGITNATSFIIGSSSAADTSTVNWLIFN